MKKQTLLEQFKEKSRLFDNFNISGKFTDEEIEELLEYATPLNWQCNMHNLWFGKKVITCNKITA